MIDMSVLLPPSHVVLPVTGKERHEIFEQLTAPLATDAIVTDTAMFLNALEERERQITTQIDTCVAIPHARSLHVSRMGLTLGLAPEPGLTFSPNDDAPRCRIFFLIAIPSFAPTAHLPVLKKLAGFARDEKQVEKLLAMKDPKKIVRLLTSYKG